MFFENCILATNCVDRVMRNNFSLFLVDLNELLGPVSSKSLEISSRYKVSVSVVLTDLSK